MTKIPYADVPPWTPRTKKLVAKIVEIVENYQSQGYTMTLRQLYYQLVTKNILPNVKNQYAKLSGLLKDARMAGIVDWDFIHDRIRVPIFPNQFSDIDHAMRTIENAYRLDRWEGQDNYVEIWVEKDALAGILEPITDEYHVHLLVNRGYSSASAMHDSALRINEKVENGKNAIIFYFGDFDPSGEDMVRDIDDRLKEFNCIVEINKVALTMKQIKEYDLPPNPAKMTDPRASEYVANHGNKSWELDALPPDVLVKMVRDAIEGAITDPDAMDEVKEQEEKDKAKIRKFGRQNKSEDES